MSPRQVESIIIITTWVVLLVSLPVSRNYVKRRFLEGAPDVRIANTSRKGSRPGSIAVPRGTGARLNWVVDDAGHLESWGLRLMDNWGYFDHLDARLGAYNLLHYIPLMANANRILHYRLELKRLKRQ